jgi:quercetin dioxygenase-like cupin family protein
MPVISASDAPRFTLSGVTFTGLAAPSRGARETAVWRIALDPGAPGAPHRVTREEIFIAVAGRAVATVGGERHEVAAGSALVIPADTLFALANPGGEPFEAVVVLPVGGQAAYEGQPPFTPPWAA